MPQLYRENAGKRACWDLLPPIRCLGGFVVLCPGARLLVRNPHALHLYGISVGNRGSKDKIICGVLYFTKRFLAGKEEREIGVRRDLFLVTLA